MRDTTIAQSYAGALFDLGERHGQTEAFAGSIELLASLLDSVPLFRQFVETPKIPAAEKKRVLQEAFARRVSPLFLNFLLVVLQKRRQRLFGVIAREYRALLDQHLGRLHVDVTLAREADAATREQIAASLSRALNKTVVPHVRVNPDILGGVIVRYGDRVLDGSLRRRLVSMRRRLVNAELPRHAAG